MTVTDHRDLVSALLGVPGVAAAAVEPTLEGAGTLRLQLVPGADEVGVAGAVNRMLRSRFGLAVDADRVRVLGDEGVRSNGAPAEPIPWSPPPRRPDPPRASSALSAPMSPADSGASSPAEQPSEPAAAEAPEVVLDRPAATARRKLLIERVQLVSAGLATSVTVSLGHDGRTVEGTADGTATAGSLHRSVAHATLRAVEQVLGEGVRFDVEHVEIARTGSDRTALVVVTMVTERANQRLSGASVVREDVRQAVIRAVLAAVNRRVEPLIVDTTPAQDTGADRPADDER